MSAGEQTRPTGGYLRVPFSVAVHERPGGGARLALRGELDVATTGDLWDAANAVSTGSAGTVRIDLSGLTFCDAAGVGCLVDLVTAFREQGRDVTLVGAPIRIRRVFELCGVDDRLG